MAIGLAVLAGILFELEALARVPYGLGTVPGRMLIFAVCALVAGVYPLIRKLRQWDDVSLRREMGM